MSEVSKVKKKQGWYKEKYDYPRLLNMMKRQLKKKPTPSLAVALIQLTNGARISEALDGYSAWLKTGKVDLEVRVRKKRGSIEYRRIVIPTFLREYRQTLKDKGVPTRQAVYLYLKEKYDVNTHTLRYTWITWHAKTLSPAYVSQIIRHSKLDMLLRYLSKHEADRLLEDIVP